MGNFSRADRFQVGFNKEVIGQQRRRFHTIKIIVIVQLLQGVDIEVQLVRNVGIRMRTSQIGDPKAQSGQTVLSPKTVKDLTIIDRIDEG